jgi:hypothetical protein
MLVEAALVLAIQHTNPEVPRRRARQYATRIQAEAKTYDLDPWVFVAIIDRETRWVPRLVRHEADGSYSVGLGQINVHSTKEVRPLRQGRTNIARMGWFLNHIRATCRSDCEDLGWLRAYNPGSAVYFTAVREQVRTYRAQAGQPVVLRLQAGVHVSEVQRQVRDRAGHERRLDARNDDPVRLDAP